MHHALLLDGGDDAFSCSTQLDAATSYVIEAWSSSLVAGALETPDCLYLREHDELTPAERAFLQAL